MRLFHLSPYWSTFLSNIPLSSFVIPLRPKSFWEWTQCNRLSIVGVLLLPKYHLMTLAFNGFCWSSMYTTRCLDLWSGSQGERRWCLVKFVLFTFKRFTYRLYCFWQQTSGYRIPPRILWANARLTTWALYFRQSSLATWASNLAWQLYLYSLIVMMDVKPTKHSTPRGHHRIVIAVLFVFNCIIHMAADGRGRGTPLTGGDCTVSSLCREHWTHVIYVTLHATCQLRK